MPRKSAICCAYERGNRAAYGHLTAEGERWALSLGTRLENNERFGRFLSWQAGASWRPLRSARVSITTRSIPRAT